MKLKVLVIQNSAIIGNKDATISNAERLLDKYKDRKPDLIIFPEVWSVGWYCKNFKKEAETLENSKTIEFLKECAINHNCIIIGGSFIRKINNEYKNSCPIINRKGELSTIYDKMHLFSHTGSEENKYVTTGEELKLIDIGITKIGISVCYDIRFPEIYRAYSKAGAEVLINVAAWSNKKLEHWEIMHKARAIENQCFMIAADQTGKITEDEYNLGHSMVINPWGEVINSLKQEEDCLYTEIEIDEVKKLRKSFPLISDRRDYGIEYFKCKEIKINE